MDGVLCRFVSVDIRVSIVVTVKLCHSSNFAASIYHGELAPASTTLGLHTSVVNKT